MSGSGEAHPLSAIGSDERWDASQDAFDRRIEDEIRNSRNPAGDDADEAALPPSMRRRSVRFSETPEVQTGAYLDETPEESPQHREGDLSFEEEEDFFEDDFGDDFDHDEDDLHPPDSDPEDEGVPLTQDLLSALDISQLPSNILAQIAPEEIAGEFEERIAHLELELRESKESQEASEREWKSRYREMDIQNGLHLTEISTMRGIAQELREKVSSYKRNLWVKSVDLDTIKLVEDEVKEVMKTRDTEAKNLVQIKDEQIRAIKAFHDADLDEHADMLNKQITDAMDSIAQKDALTTNPVELEKADMVHQSITDPLDILKSLSQINFELHSKIFGADEKVKIKDVLREYRERELSLLQEHIGEPPSEDLARQLEVMEEDIEKGRLDRAELCEHLSELSEQARVVEELLPTLDAEKPAKEKFPKAGGSESPASSPSSSPRNRETLSTVKKAFALAMSTLAEYSEKLKQYDEDRLKEEDRRLLNPSLETVNMDPVFAAALHNSKFAKRFEAVLRENELLKARIHILGDTQRTPADVADLTEKAEVLEARCKHLNLQCNDLEDQKKSLKGLRDDMAREAEEYADAVPYLDGKQRIGEIVDQTDSEMTASVDDSSGGDVDLFDPAAEMAQDQIAGVEVHVEEPENEDGRQYDLEKKQFTATMRKESHVASLVEQILQYLECGTTVFRVKGTKIEKKFAFLTANRSVILLCDFVEGKPNKKVGLEQLHLRTIKSIILGQSSWDKKIIKNAANKRIDPEQLHEVPKDTEGVEIYNTGTYYYRSVTLKRRSGENFNFIANSDNDYETWVVALHRITTLDPEHDKILDVVKNCYKGAEVLVEEERVFCEMNHVPPLLYLNAKMQCLKQEHKLFLTLYDVRTLSGFHLLQSQKVFELWLSLCWVEKQYVYQVKYLNFFPEEASNLMELIDQQRVKKQKEESERMLHQQGAVE